MVHIDNIISVSTKSSLFKLVSSKSNGLILQDLDNGKTNFYSSRTFQFSPLESIGIYTLSDNIPLKDVYDRFINYETEHKIPEESDPDVEYKSFFEKVIPEYDRYRVHIRDMKKCLKWYRKLKHLELVKADSEDTKPSENPQAS